MTYRFKKQFIIITVLVVILLIFGFLFYLFSRPAPSCYDGIKNQGEEEVDCGGPCIPCEVKSLKPVKVIWVKALAIKDKQGVYDVAAQIRNPNQNYGLSKLSYEFKLYDESDSLIFSKKNSTFILPNETKYIIEPRLEVNQSISKISLVLEPGEPGDWQKLKDFEKNQLFIKNKNYQLLESGPGFSQVSGIVKNASAFDFDKVQINVILFNQQHEVVGVNKTEMRTLLSGEERYFLTTWFSKIEDEVFFVDVEAETNVFIDENFMKRYGAPEKFQEMSF